jgi:hypothetical protein
MPANHISGEARHRCVARAALIVSASIALWSGAAAAQDNTLENGARIRIQSSNEKQVLEGTFRSFSGDSVIFSPGLDTSKQALSLSRVGKIEVSRYNLRARSVLADAAIGSAVGLGATLAIAGGCGIFHGDCLGLIFAAPAMIGGGFLIGAVIGSQNRSEHWYQVYPQERSANLLIGPSARGGVLVGLSVPFGSAPSR